MIPHFPEFKKLELELKDHVEIFTRRHPPHSDFNFTSMWSWDITGEKYVSELNGNLVVRFNDYITGELFYSFLGNNKPNETAQTLLDFLTENRLPAKLKLVPEDSIKGLDTDRFEVAEDRDNHDYIYSIEDLVRMEGGAFKSKRRQAKFFEENIPHTIKELDLRDSAVKEEIMALCNEWALGKNDTAEDSQNEYQAILRFLSAPQSNHLAMGIYASDKLIAAGMIEHIDDDYATYHFKKALTSSFKGIEPYLMREFMKILSSKNIKYLNREQDLGIPGLRESKESYSPRRYLKKFHLSTIRKIGN